MQSSMGQPQCPGISGLTVGHITTSTQCVVQDSMKEVSVRVGVKAEGTVQLTSMADDQ